MTDAPRDAACPHCGDVHPVDTTFCPATGRPMPVAPRTSTKSFGVAATAQFVSRPSGLSPLFNQGSAPRASAPAPMRPDLASRIDAAMRGADDVLPVTGISAGTAGLDAKSAPAPQAFDPSQYPEATRLYGTLIEGKYRVEHLIGVGGMGAVYRGEHVRLQRPVAIKILLHSYSAGSAAEMRFYREARIAGSIGHPNIPDVFDMGTLEDGSPFLVMELLHGETLGARIDRDGAMPIDEVCGIVEQVLHALSAAHGKGIVHRDLKPDNVFLVARTDGPALAKLLDFGISKSLLDVKNGSLTEPGMMIGTPVYFSPEQARVDPNTDHRVDIWAAGVLLYEALTGFVPWATQSLTELIVKIISESPPAPTSHRKEIGPALEGVIQRAMRRTREERFQSAAEMLTALQTARREWAGAASAATMAPPPVAPQPTRTATMRRPTAPTAMLDLTSHDDEPDLADFDSAELDAVHVNARKRPTRSNAIPDLVADQDEEPDLAEFGTNPLGERKR